jgi:arginine N-succinyltransferase
MLVLRPVELTDLPQLQQLARDSLVGVTSLPDDTERLREKILASCASFEKDVQGHGPENYFFVLEDLMARHLVGCSEILATAGFNEPFYSLRNRHFTSASRELNIEHGVPALSLCHDLSGHTLLRGFHINAALERTRFSELLSRARLLFIAAHKTRFAEAVITEIVGYSDEQGQSPFWDALGKHFFDLPYVEAERLCGLQSRTFLAELMPQYPIYVPMLPPAAQACIGRIHPDGQEAFDILEREGFETNSYIDLFDAGPTLYARTSKIRSIAQSQTGAVHSGPAINARGSSLVSNYLVSNDSLKDYRAIVAELDYHAGQPVALSAEMCAALKVTDTSAIRLIAL